jgi:hypothetical protein
MDALHAQPDELKTHQDASQVLAFRSNANLLATNINRVTARSAEVRAAKPGGREAQRVAGALAPLRNVMLDPDPNIRNSVVTRDVTHTELFEGLTESRRLVSSNERMGERKGPMRNVQDSNRGGAAGSYTRTVSGRRLPVARAAHASPAAYDPRKDATLAPLGVGSIGNAGITLTFDAARAIGDVQHPLELFHNQRDSAGRVFGRHSERKLGAMNERYHKADPDAVRQPFSARRAIKAATKGQRELAHTIRHPSEETDHNEQIWTTPPSLHHVNAVVVQKQLDRPPRLERKTTEALERETATRTAKHAALEQQKAELLRRHRANEITHPELVSKRAKLMTAQRKLEGPPERHNVIDQSARLPKELRVASFWADGKTPPGYAGLAGLAGVGGRSFRNLMVHAPPSVKRAELPGIAQANLQPGRKTQLYPHPPGA